MSCTSKRNFSQNWELWYGRGCFKYPNFHSLGHFQGQPFQLFRDFGTYLVHSLVTRKWLLCIRKSASLSSFALSCSKWPSFPSSYSGVLTECTDFGLLPCANQLDAPSEYEEGKEGHLEQKRTKEDSDALFLIQRSHFLFTSVIFPR